MAVCTCTRLITIGKYCVWLHNIYHLFMLCMTQLTRLLISLSGFVQPDTTVVDIYLLTKQIYFFCAQINYEMHYLGRN